MIALGFVAMLQCFHPTKIVQQIESASDEFMNDVIDADVEVKKILFIFMENLTFPKLTLNLFGFVDVNLKTFLMVIIKT